MAAIAFNPTLALPARVTLAKVRARSVAVRASARPAGSRAASKIDTESQSLAVSDASDSKGLALAALAAAPVVGLAWATRDRALAYTKVARLQRDLEDVRDRAPSLRASKWSSK